MVNLLTMMICAETSIYDDADVESIVEKYAAVEFIATSETTETSCINRVIKTFTVVDNKLVTEENSDFKEHVEDEVTTADLRVTNIPMSLAELNLAVKDKSIEERKRFLTTLLAGNTDLNNNVIKWVYEITPNSLSYRLFTTTERAIKATNKKLAEVLVAV